MKFLMTTTFYPPFHIGGDAVFVKRLAEELVNRGHEVHVMFSYDAYKLKGFKNGNTILQNEVRLHILNSPHGRISPISAYTWGKSIHYSRQFKKLVDEIHPDVVNHHNVSLLGYDLFFKRGEYVNVHTIQDHWLICQLNGLFKDEMICDRTGSCVACAMRHKRPPQFWRNRKGFESAKGNLDIVIASSQYMKNILAKEFKEPISMLPNFVPKPPDTITSSGISDYYLYAGVLEEHKGVLDLLNAWLGMRCYKGTESGLVFAGDGSLRRLLEDKVKEYADYGINNLFVLGKCNMSKLYSLYYGAIALIVPSRCPDNNPLVALEALSVGTPAITSNVGGLPEIADLQGKGFCTDKANLVNFISYWDHHPRPSRDYLRKIYSDHFSTDKYIENYLNVIATKLGKK